MIFLSKMTMFGINHVQLNSTSLPQTSSNDNGKWVRLLSITNLMIQIGLLKIYISPIWDGLSSSKVYSSPTNHKIFDNISKWQWMFPDNLLFANLSIKLSQKDSYWRWHFFCMLYSKLQHLCPYHSCQCQIEPQYYRTLQLDYNIW